MNAGLFVALRSVPFAQLSAIIDGIASRCLGSTQPLLKGALVTLEAPASADLGFGNPMMSSHESQSLLRPLLDRVVVEIRAHPKSVRTVL